MTLYNAAFVTAECHVLHTAQQLSGNKCVGKFSTFQLLVDRRFLKLWLGCRPQGDALRIIVINMVFAV